MYHVVGWNNVRLHVAQMSKGAGTHLIIRFCMQSKASSKLRTGYLTMEQTRKLVVLSETDPKAFELPLVGVWVSGAMELQEPLVWAACTRYLSMPADTATTIKSADGSGAFLLLLYTQGAVPITRVFECTPGQTKLPYVLARQTLRFALPVPKDAASLSCNLSASESAELRKVLLSSSGGPLGAAIEKISAFGCGTHIYAARQTISEPAIDEFQTNCSRCLPIGSRAQEMQTLSHPEPALSQHPLCLHEQPQTVSLSPMRGAINHDQDSKDSETHENPSGSHPIKQIMQSPPAQVEEKSANRSSAQEEADLSGSDATALHKLFVQMQAQIQVLTSRVDEQQAMIAELSSQLQLARELHEVNPAGEDVPVTLSSQMHDALNDKHDPTSGVPPHEESIEAVDSEEGEDRHLQTSHLQLNVDAVEESHQPTLAINIDPDEDLPRILYIPDDDDDDDQSNADFNLHQLEDYSGDHDDETILPLVSPLIEVK